MIDRLEAPALRVGLAVVGALAVVGLLTTTGRTSIGLGALGLFAVIAVSSRVEPELILAALIVILPLQQALFSFGLASGLPVALLRAAALWKELLVTVIAVRAVAAHRRRGTRLDGIDKTALAFIAIATLYLVLPVLLHDPTGPPPFGSGLPLSVRFVAYRGNVLFVVLFLAMRHSDLSPRAGQRVVKAVMLAAAIVAAGALLEASSPSSWDRFVLHTLQVPRYQNVVQGVKQSLIESVVRGLAGARRIRRVGSVFFSPLPCGFYLVMAVAVCLERVSRGRHRLSSALVGAVAAVALVLTFTRSALLAGAVAVVWVARPLRGRLARFRMQFFVGLGFALIAFGGFAYSSGAVSRLSSAFGGSDTSTTAHQQRSSSALSLVLKAPLGQGLGTNPSLNGRADVTSTVTSENSYLQVGNELGVVEMIVFAVLLLMLVHRLRTVAPAIQGDTAALAAGLAAAGAGLVIGGLFLHVWTDLAISVAFWGASGLALGVAGGEGDGATATAVDADRPVELV